MSNLQTNLDNRVDALFIETKKELLVIAAQVESSIPRNSKADPFENLAEKLKESELTIKSISTELLDFSNRSILDFETEIETVREPEKSKAIEKYRNLLIAEIQDLVKLGFKERVTK